MTLVNITPAASYPVSVAEVKANGRISDDVEDTLIEDTIAAATAYVERENELPLVSQTWEEVLDRFPSGPIIINYGPITEVLSVKYIDTDGDEQTMSSDDYSVDTVSRSGRVYSYSAWPSTKEDTYSTVRVRFTTGATASEDVKKAIILLSQHWLENRAAVIEGGTFAEVPMSTKMLMSLHRRYFV